MIGFRGVFISIKSFTWSNDFDASMNGAESEKKAD